MGTREGADARGSAAVIEGRSREAYARMAWKATDRPMTTVEIRMYSSSRVRQATGGENCRPEVIWGLSVQELSVVLAGDEPMR